jgi:hypothetical protein
METLCIDFSWGQSNRLFAWDWDKKNCVQIFGSADVQNVSACFLMAAQIFKYYSDIIYACFWQWKQLEL